ncbi:MAG: D-glycerate dehydrogenase [Chloroflexota bacterium]|nr:D-glycerate dehydrogenase [Chloroflexota bacterium]
MARVYVTRQIPQAGLDLLAREHEVEVWPGEMPPDREELLRGVASADALLCLLTDKVDSEVLEAASSLRVVANHAVGYENVDVQAATRLGIVVTNTPDVLTETTADFAWALMLAAARRIPEGIEYVREGRWRTWGPELLLGPDVSGATLGLVGLGRIGSAVARRARGFEMRVLYHTPRPHPEETEAEWMELDTLIAESDFLSLHTPLTPETRGLLDARRLSLMKPTAVLVNTARGPVVDTQALEDALREGRLFAAALDVTDPEPLPADHPLVSLPNCIVVPHIASASYATRARMARMAVENVLAVLSGRPAPNAVNPEALRNVRSGP